MTMQQDIKIISKVTSKPVNRTCSWGQRIDRLVPNVAAFCDRHDISRRTFNGIHEKDSNYIQSTTWAVFDDIRRGLEIDLCRPILWEQLLFDPQLGLVDMGHLKEWEKRYIFSYPKCPSGLDTLRERVLWLMGYRGWTTGDISCFGYHSPSWLSSAIKGKMHSPSMCSLQDLCLVFGCTYDWLLGGLKHEYPKYSREGQHRGPRKKNN